MDSGKQTQHLVSSFADIKFNWWPAGIETISFKYPNPTADATNGAYVDYNLSSWSWQGLNYGFDNLVTGTGTLNVESYGTSSDSIDAIWGGFCGNMDAWIKNLALSLSNHVRIYSPTYREEYAGTAYVQGVQVQWWWITLPATVLASSILLLVIVMIRTARSEIRAWKGSPLVFLFWDVDEDIRREAEMTRCFDRVTGMDGVGERRVVLRKTEKDRWIFEGT